MPLWLLAAALAVLPARVAAQDAPAAQAGQAQDLSDTDKGLLTQAGYAVGQDGVRTPAPESRLLEEQELPAVLAKLRAQQSRKVLGDLEALQDKYLQNGKLSREERLKGQLALAQNWELLPPQARDGFNAVLQEAGAQPVTGLDLGWVEKVTKSWDKAVAGTLPAADTRPGGGLVAAPTFTPLKPPSRQEIDRRIARVEAARMKDPDSGALTPYPPDVQTALKEVMRYAADQDSAAVLRVLEKRHPVITRDNKQMFANADGVSHNPSFYDTGADAVYRLALPDSYVYAPPPKGGKTGIEVPIVEAPFYTSLGVPPPQLEPFQGAKPSSVEKAPEGVYEHFADGSWRFRPDPKVQAPVLLHELLHLDTGSEGAGAHALTNEMRSFYAQKRMGYNRDEALGLTKKPGYGSDEGDYPWLKKPLQYRSKILGVYMSPAVGEVSADRVLVSAQLAATDRALATTGEDFERLRQAELERRLDVISKEQKAVFDELEQKKLLTSAQAERGRDAVDAKTAELRQSPAFKDWDYRAALQDERRRLLRDQAMALTNVGDDIKFHESVGIPYASGVK